MVLTTSWRCLRNSSLRSAVTPAITPAAVSYFSTSPAFAAAATKSKPLSKPPRKGGYALGINKKTTKDTHTKAAYKHGERKEIRNRIILSNTNAPVLPTPEMTVEVSLHEPAVGTLFSFSNSDIDGLRAVGAFQRGQNWKFFQRPSTVMRHETLVMGEMLARIQGGEEESGTMERLVVTGPKGSGKSVFMAQAMAIALQRNWVVINIPKAQDLVIGHTEYDQDPTSKLWVQREYAKSLLQKIGSKANIEVLKSQKLSQAYKFGNREFDPKDSSLDKLVAAGASDAKISPDVLSALLTELEADLPGRQPVLFTLDGLERIMLPTAYRDQDFNIIHAHDLAIPNAFLSYLNGTRSFRRGLVMGATSASGAPRTEALEYAIMGKKLPNYSKLDPRVAASMEGAEVMVLGSMHKDEVKSLLEYCVDSGLLKDPTALQDEQLAQRYTLCSGLPKEVVASCVRIRC